jgi:ABC-type Zn uptake system ZnuABC Zn-binding protein ZnuA
VTPGARRRAAAALALGLALGAAPAAGAADVEAVASVHPLALLLRAVGGERVAVHVLVPPGASPHTFEPRPGDLARLARADLFVQVGGGLDDWAGRLLDAAPGGLRRRLLLSAPGLAAPGAPEPSGRAPADPHVWLDPVAVRDALAPALVDDLCALDPAHASEYRTRLAAFRDELSALDAEIRARLAEAPGRRYVAFHNAWRWFARRYGLEEVGVVHEVAGEEPGPRELARLVGEARRAGVAAILVEPQLAARTARVIAAEYGGRTVVVDPLGDPTDPERSTYAGLLRWNARAFRAALGGGAP